KHLFVFSFSWERRPSLPACFVQSAIAGNPQARMGGAPRGILPRRSRRQRPLNVVGGEPAAAEPIAEPAVGPAVGPAVEPAVEPAVGLDAEPVAGAASEH